ncbi:MAG: hypothetical protein LBC96_09350, partial [Lachnospiraceae bacterium]|nr:hypothetical protein [Lachnospiraceae bacterium]
MNEVQQCIQEKMKFNEAFLAQNLPQTDSFSSAEISFHSENEEDVFQLTPETAAKYGIPYRQLVVPDVETAKKLTGTPDIFFDENIVSAEGCADYIDWSQQENRTAKNLCTLTAAYIYGDSRKVKQHEKLINKASFPLTIDYYGSSSTDYR